eukprot:5291803-Amphidinium_carterae.1
MGPKRLLLLLLPPPPILLVPNLLSPQAQLTFSTCIADQKSLQTVVDMISELQNIDKLCKNIPVGTGKQKINLTYSSGGYHKDKTHATKIKILTSISKCKMRAPGRSFASGSCKMQMSFQQTGRTHGWARFFSNSCPM